MEEIHIDKQPKTAEEHMGTAIGSLSLHDKQHLFWETVNSQPRVTMMFQTGPKRLVGENGMQVDQLIQLSIELLKSYNCEYPCRENSITLTKLQEAWMWQQRRTADREKRKVEGSYSK